MIISTIKKLISLTLLSTLVLFASCNQYEKIDKITLDEVRSLHNDIHLRFQKSINTYTGEKYSNQLIKLESISKKISTHGLDKTMHDMSNNNYSKYKSLVAKLDGFSTKIDLYNYIIDTYDSFQLSEINEMLVLYETKAHLNNVLKNNINPKKLHKVSSDCGWAIAGYVVTAMSAVAIGGPVGLGFWLAAEVLSTRSLINDC